MAPDYTLTTNRVLRLADAHLIVLEKNGIAGPQLRWRGLFVSEEGALRVVDWGRRSADDMVGAEGRN